MNIIQLVRDDEWGDICVYLDGKLLGIDADLSIEYLVGCLDGGLPFVDKNIRVISPEWADNDTWYPENYSDLKFKS